VQIRIKSSSLSQFGTKLYTSISFTFLVITIFVNRFYGGRAGVVGGSDGTKIFLVKSDPKRNTFFNRTDFISKKIGRWCTLPWVL